KLDPRMIQSMEILQMSSQQLEERLEQELTSTPTLELREPGPDEADLDAQRNQAERDSREGERDLVVRDDAVDPNHRDDFERLSNLSDEIGDGWEASQFETGEGFRRPQASGERDAKMDAMINTAARPQSLAEQLLNQWRLVETAPETLRAGTYLIEFIDDDGYIRTDRQTLLDQAPPDFDEQLLDSALELLKRSLDPPGLAARDLRECWLLQMDAAARQDDAPDLSVMRLLVAEHLKDLEMNRLPQIAKATNLTLEQINQAKHDLRQFHPHPGRLLIDDAPRAITPDAIVEFDEANDRYVATLTNGRIPNVQISRRYLNMARSPAFDRKTKEFVGNNIRSARWLLDAIEQRKSTLLRVINVVIEAQRNFFDEGAQALKPLPMTNVADQLGIHVATVSRAVNEKYIQTPRGIFPLRMYFSGGTETDSGDAMSWAAIQARLESIIDQENKANPLNDDQLVEKLKDNGIDIARRTVAKYRKQLNIPPARQRKQFA
ncbi:MAG: RNA polymerase factor sigma-54, partial [Pirellulaceae bacterium]|nr:RNA polymerase factor sigma-54 [Pirellulaceae bacterium]